MDLKNYDLETIERFKFLWNKHCKDIMDGGFRCNIDPKITQRNMSVMNDFVNIIKMRVEEGY
jgi:hypothetical protein